MSNASGMPPACTIPLDLYGIESRFLLKRIHDNPGILRAALLGDRALDDPVGDPPGILAALVGLDFVREAGSGLTLTLNGLDFLAGL